MGQELNVIQANQLSNQQTHFELPFPLVLHCQTTHAQPEAVARWVCAEKTNLLDSATRHGAVLFRGFPVGSVEDFDAFVAAFELKNFPYDESLSNAVRINRSVRVFTANEAPPDVAILLHHEMAQTPMFPSRLFFFCEEPAEQGGATPICRSDVLFNRLGNRRPDFIRACEEKGLKYSNVMPPEADLRSGMGRSWQSTFGVNSREAAEDRMRQLKYSWEWRAGGSLRATTPVLPAIRKLPSGRKSFFNQLIAAFHGWKDSRNDPLNAVTFGDESALNPDDVDEARRIAEEITVDIPWRRGDIALVDNFVTMHGRRVFEGTRRVFVSLAAADD